MNISIIKREAFWHAIFWLAYFFTRLAFVNLYSVEWPYRMLFSAMEMPLKILLFYSVTYWLIPQFAVKKKYVKLIAFSLLLLFILALLRRIVLAYGILPILHEINSPEVNFYFWNWQRIIGGLTYLYPIAGLGVAIFFTRSWFISQWEKQQIEKEKVSAELSLLKSQIHPHFLFNTLNNIYSLSLKKSDETPEAIIKLSDLLSYMIYDCQTKFVSLSKEVEYLKSYIELERLRYGDKLDISLSINESSLLGVEIAPLLLLPFLENSFKHGVSNSIQQAWITLNLSVTNNQLNFSLANSKPTIEVSQTSSTINDNHSGIGLQNITKRLELIYPNRHKIKITDQAESFDVKLTIDLLPILETKKL